MSNLMSFAPGKAMSVLTMLFLFGAILASPSLSNAEEMQNKQVAVIRLLDKVTARVSTAEVDTGKSVKFGTLEVRIRSCFKSPPTSRPESVAFVEVFDNKTQADKAVFSGWMFASSPALSALEHPVYDVWLLSCEAERPSKAAKVENNPITAKPNDASSSTESEKPAISQMD